ncbi:unnamed protein product [Oppiella nova]|uniref:long-chain-fatty-acid--CoA ligase n=1 Tax=Oppiella nova TaxID=334625 RepID=A0A7R9M7X1_9ACAR|nr:unnamed protein product [Oppiella nova]CAG2172439.1 unnamed protein product [Oppiella nova]
MMRRLYPLDSPCIGYRKVLEEQVCTDSEGNAVRLDGKVLRKFRLSPYVWMTYGEVYDKIDSISRGMVSNGFQRKDKIVILSETSADNLIFLQVCMNIGAVIVTVFATLGDEGITHCINETKATILYTTYDLLPKVQNILKSCPTISKIIFVDNTKHPIKTTNNINFEPHIKLVSTIELYDAGKQIQMDLDAWACEPNELQIICYTSGTTGVPKGIEMTSYQMIRAGISTSAAMQYFFDEPERHIYIAYLPQSHSLELSIETYAFMGGLRVGFASPFTLNESAPGLAEGETCDLKLLRPTTMVTVPLVLDRMRKEIYHKLRARTPVSAPIFTYLIDYKHHWMTKGYNCPLVNRLLCPKVTQQFGGRLEFMVVGGAALSPDLQKLIKCALNVRLVQGYGATETFGAAICMDDVDQSLGRCGPPLKDIHIKLDDWPEGGYKATDRPNPRGELVVGGPGVATGYYNNKELSDESFETSGDGMRWFRTGDIGEVFPDGTVRIIDRKKDLIKLSNGEYFSLGKIESYLKNCQYVDNICIIGHKFSNYLIGLVIPNQKSLISLATGEKLSDRSLQELCKCQPIIDCIHKDITESGLQYGLKKAEIPTKIMICADEWSPDNGMLTAAMKLKRNNIMKKYEKDIEVMFI